MSDADIRLALLTTRVVQVIRDRTGLHEQFARPIAVEIIETFRCQVEPDLIGNLLSTEYGGERVYVPTRDPDLFRKVATEFDGRNRAELCAKYGISRSTFYNFLGRARGNKARPGPSNDDFSV